MAVEVTIKKWGNSIGVVFPKDFAVKRRLKVDERVLIEVVKEANIKKLFGSLERKMSGQQFKDMVRKGWE